MMARSIDTGQQLLQGYPPDTWLISVAQSLLLAQADSHTVWDDNADTNNIVWIEARSVDLKPQTLTQLAHLAQQHVDQHASRRLAREQDLQSGRTGLNESAGMFMIHRCIAPINP